MVAQLDDIYALFICQQSTCWVCRCEIVATWGRSKSAMQCTYLHFIFSQRKVCCRWVQAFQSNMLYLWIKKSLKICFIDHSAVHCHYVYMVQYNSRLVDMWIPGVSGVEGFKICGSEEEGFAGLPSNWFWHCQIIVCNPILYCFSNIGEVLTENLLKWYWMFIN